MLLWRSATLLQRSTILSESRSFLSALLRREVPLSPGTPAFGASLGGKRPFSGEAPGSRRVPPGEAARASASRKKLNSPGGAPLLPRRSATSPIGANGASPPIGASLALLLRRPSFRWRFSGARPFFVPGNSEGNWRFPQGSAASRLKQWRFSRIAQGIGASPEKRRVSRERCHASPGPPCS